MIPKNLLSMVEFLPDRPRTQLVHDSDNMRLVLFCIKAGQEVPHHSSSSEVVVCTLKGEGKFYIGEQEMALCAGCLAVCPPNQSHAIKADKDLVVLAMISPRPSMNGS